MGKGNYANGIFNLYVSFDYDARNYMDEWRNAFNRASKRLLEATGGMMKFGTITVANNGASFTRKVDPKYEADVVIYGPSTKPHQIYVCTRQSCFAQDCNNGPCLGLNLRYFTVCHEDRWQEWFIIHEFSHYALCLYDENKDQVGGTSGTCCNLQNSSKCIMEVCDSIVTHYCDDAEHTPNNMQELKNQESCLATIRRKYPDILGREPFTDHNIEWVVL